MLFFQPIDDLLIRMTGAPVFSVHQHVASTIAGQFDPGIPFSIPRSKIEHDRQEDDTNGSHLDRPAQPCVIVLCRLFASSEATSAATPPHATLPA